MTAWDCLDGWVTVLQGCLCGESRSRGAVMNKWELEATHFFGFAYQQ